ncbi:MAG: FlgD immunoglobulin-like domain containing protein, partial [Candidatus Ventricola sp.]
ACFSGALIGRGRPGAGMLPGALPPSDTLPSPFLADPSIHVLTSASGEESSWYYDSEHLSTGAVSYFASALSSGLGLYGTAEADIDGDGRVTLAELHRYLRVAVPSSSSQLLSANADALTLPVAHGAMLSRPLTGFSYGASLLSAADPVLDFAFTAAQEGVGVQYRLVDFADGSWDWEHAKTFLDAGDDASGVLVPGRKTRSLALEGVLPGDSGYLMLQIFSVLGSELTLCSERLIAVQPQTDAAALTLDTRNVLPRPGTQELPIDVKLDVPAELTVCVYDAEGAPVRRIASGQLTRPAADGVTHLYWDGRDEDGQPVADGFYTLTAEARVGSARVKATAGIRVGS